MRRLKFIQVIAGVALPFPLRAGSPVRKKLESIEKKSVPSGETVRFSRQELLEFAHEELREKKVNGIWNPTFTLGTNHATGAATVDFHRLQASVQERPPGILSRLLLSGARRVEVEVRLSSERGWARVDVLSAEVDGWNIEGRALEWLINTYVMSRYPKARINEWFELESNVRQVALSPAELTVLIA